MVYICTRFLKSILTVVEVLELKREKKKTLKKVCGIEKVVVCLPPVSTKGQKREVNKIEKVL